ncbi:MAG: GNAT family N-acetyltransferase [Verrucomicrobiota bacterium]
MPPPVKLRAATAADREFLVEVYAATRMEELAATDWSAEQKDQFCRMQFNAQDSHYRQHFAAAKYAVIEFAGVPAGRLSMDLSPDEVRVMELALLPPFRGRGIGTHLLSSLQRDALVTGQCLTIHVERSNPAQSLYQRLGFRLLEDKGVYLLLEWRPTAELR